MTVTRFAPSPTGPLHVGNLRSALFNWLAARKAGGTFLLRIDDTDEERSEERWVEAIRADLDWLGLGWDRFARQSERPDAYRAAADRLREAGRLYPCYETETELALRRRTLLAAGRPPIYDRAALRLTEGERAEKEAQGLRPHWRFLLDRERVIWDDAVRGEQPVDCASLSDPVLIREDGTILYTLASVVDDAEMGVTQVVRGEDHVTNTAVQIQLFEALGTAAPRFAHHSLLVGADGAALSKRLGSLTLASLRDEGVEPMAVLSYLARLGTSDPIEPRTDHAALVEGFALDRLGRAPARFDREEIDAVQAKVVHELPFAAVEARLRALGIEGGEAFWLAVRGNCARVEDAAGWWSVVTGPVSPVIEPEDAGFVADAMTRLDALRPWDEGTWKVWTGALKDGTGRKGRALFMPLRKALTGLDHGPDMAALLPLLRRDTLPTEGEGA